MMFRIITPNSLTMARIVSVPLLVILWWFKFDNYQWWSLLIFVIASLTDYADGVIARNYNLFTRFGRIMDPISDKILVASVLLMLSADNVIEGIHLIAALIILAREITVSGLREFLQEIKVTVPVSKLAKYKTATQMTALGFLVAPNVNLGMVTAHVIGMVLLWIAAVFTLVTGYDYLKSGLDYMNE